MPENKTTFLPSARYQPMSTPKDQLLVDSWHRYKNSPAYQNSKNWAIHPEYTEGSLWAAFVEGWKARDQADPNPEGEK